MGIECLHGSEMNSEAFMFVKKARVDAQKFRCLQNRQSTWLSHQTTTWFYRIFKNQHFTFRARRVQRAQLPQPILTTSISQAEPQLPPTTHLLHRSHQQRLSKNGHCNCPGYYIAFSIVSCHARFLCASCLLLIQVWRFLISGPRPC
jgi:hypothetical protein